MSDTFTSQAQAEAISPFAAAPGNKTSEYGMTVFTQFVAAVVALVALFSPGFEMGDTEQAVIVSFAGSAMTLSQMAYAWSRSRVKIAAAQAAGQVAGQPPIIVEKAESVVNAISTDGVGPLQSDVGAR